MTSPAARDSFAAARERPTLRDAQRDLTRRRIIDAALTVFERTGFGRATVGDIATEAAINRATFYAHFSSKTVLFDAILADLAATAIPYFVELDRALITGSRAAVRGWLYLAFEWWEQNATIYAAWQEAAASDRHFAARWQAVLDQEMVEIGQFLAQIPAEERDVVRTRVQFMVIQLDQICFRWQVQRVLEMDRNRVLDVLTGIWCSVLGIEG